MEIGAWADWVNVVATAILALIAGVWSFWSYRKQRDPELNFILTNVSVDEREESKGDPKGYQILVLNNSTSNYVVLKNEVPRATGLYKSKYVEQPFYADVIVKPQENTPLCQFKGNLRYGLKLNDDREVTPELDYVSWYVTDVINHKYYKLTLLAPKKEDANHLLRLKVTKRKAPLSNERIKAIKRDCPNSDAKKGSQVVL